MNIFRWWLMSRRTHVEPLNWIGLVASARFVKVFGSILELGGKFGYQLNADLVAAGTDRRTNRGEKIVGLAAEFSLHAANGFLRDACEGAAPAGVNCSDSSFLGIDQKNRHAIGG